MMLHPVRVASLLVCVALASVSCGRVTPAYASNSTTAQNTARDTTAPAPAFDKREVQVAMCDGVHLHTVIFSPKNTSADLPIIMSRTPYGAPVDGTILANPVLADLIADGYIFVFQDIRGRFGSEGKFVMLRPMRNKSDPHAVDESTDAYDTVDWLVKNVTHNNGRVGMMGTSYPGWLTVMAMLDPHPALKAVSPRASYPPDVWPRFHVVAVAG